VVMRSNVLKLLYFDYNLRRRRRRRWGDTFS